MTFLSQKQPDYLRTVRYRIAGYRPPKSILRKIHRHHPACTLMWENTRQRWVLVQHDQAQLHVIRVLQNHRGEFEAPNLDNTVGYLDSCSPANFMNKWAMDRWLEKNISDELPADPVVERRIESNIGEFSDRLWHLQGKSLALVPHPKTKE